MKPDFEKPDEVVKSDSSDDELEASQMSLYKKPVTSQITSVNEIIPHVICVLCQDYFTEPATMVECLHSCK